MTWPVPHSPLPIVRACLFAALDGVAVSTADPSTRPDEYVVLDLLPGDYPFPNVTEPRVMANCFAKSSLLGGELGSKVLGAFRNARGTFSGVEVRKCFDITGPYRLDDPRITDRVRFQVRGTFRLSTR